MNYHPTPWTGAELLFESLSQPYECATALVASNLPFEEWTEVFGSERLTGALCSIALLITPTSWK